GVFPHWVLPAAIPQHRPVTFPSDGLSWIVAKTTEVGRAGDDYFWQRTARRARPYSRRNYKREIPCPSSLLARSKSARDRRLCASREFSRRSPAATRFWRLTSARRSRGRKQ